MGGRGGEQASVSCREVWGWGRALAFRRVTAGIMAADPVQGWGRVRLGGGAVITSQAHPPPYFRGNSFFLRVQLRAQLAARPRGILMLEWGWGCVPEDFKSRFLKGF